MSENDETIASEWQKRITGEWYGIPSVFDAEGGHTGFNKVNRSSVDAAGEVTYYMHCQWESVGPLRNRLEYNDFAFGVDPAGSDRIYLGPDLLGTGQPYGDFVDAHYYSPGWAADLRTMNHVLPDGITQVYSSQLFDGQTLFAVFNGIYRVAHDYETNETTQAEIDAFLENERRVGALPHTLPFKEKGAWTGALEVYGADQQPQGMVDVSIQHDPVEMLRHRQRIEISGTFDRSWELTRHKTGNRHTFDGPDVWGNGMAYGRALYTTQHIHPTAEKIQGREFIIDDDYSLAITWKYFDGDRLDRVVFGLLSWSPS